MPQLIFKGMPEQWVAEQAPQMIPSLAKIVGCPADWFALEWCPSTFYTNAGKEERHPVVQVWWFERLAEIQQKTASYLGETMIKSGLPSAQITFHPFSRSGYYEY